jgi:carboxypeptidase C (cathepsin A)
MVPVARIVQKLRVPHLPTRMEGSDKRLERFGKFLANRFFGGGSVKEKSENRRVIIGLNGGPGWT